VVVTGGKATYGFSFNGIPFAPTEEDLCSQVECPLVSGPYTNTTITQFPAGVKGKIVSTIKWFDLSSVLLYCLELTVKI
jgi:hypothetical protein